MVAQRAMGYSLPRQSNHQNAETGGHGKYVERGGLCNATFYPLILPLEWGRRAAPDFNPQSTRPRIPDVPLRISRLDVFTLPSGTAAIALFVFSLAGQPCRAADLNEIVRRAAEALKADWTADPSYACLERDETQKHGKSSSKTFEVIMIDGSEYRLPVANDDRPLPPDRHDAELLKLRQEMERRHNESQSARRSRIEAWKKQRDGNGEILLDFPSALDFQFIGEESKNGYPAYVLSAMPKPGIVAVTRASKVLTGIKGRAWVEKENFHPIAVECTVMRPVPVYGPLASVLPGTDIQITMDRVADATWLIDLVSMKLNISKLHLVNSSTITRSTYTRYRPNADEIRDLLAEADRLLATR